jgi:hypothetical protein
MFYVYSYVQRFDLTENLVKFFLEFEGLKHTLNKALVLAMHGTGTGWQGKGMHA